MHRYGVLVFVVEMLGASTTLLYGLNLVWRPVNEMPSPDEERHGLTKARLKLLLVADVHCCRCLAALWCDALCTRLQVQTRCVTAQNRGLNEQCWPGAAGFARP